MSFFEITLPLPPSVNRMYRVFRGRVHLVKEGKDYKAKIAELALKKYKTLAPIHGPVEVTIKIFRKRKSGDIDNFMKCLLDGMQKIFYKNDSQIVRLLAIRGDDKDNPRVEVTVNAV